MSLFTFGCSFTQYKWPTWADIVGQEFESYENWGQSGGGNQFIFNSLIECLVKNKISMNDTVIIMWSSFAREDRYVDGKWITSGGIFTQDVYDGQFVKKFADLRGYCIRDYNTIFAAQNILKNIGCKFYFLSMLPLTNPDQYHNDNCTDKIADLLTYFKPILDQTRSSIYEVIFNFDWCSRPRPFVYDGHSATKKNQYNAIKDPSWPVWPGSLYSTTEDRAFLTALSDKIKKECLETFGLDLYKSTTPKDAPASRVKQLDLHPTPSEHLEYLEKVLPEISISQSTKDWVAHVDTQARSSEPCSPWAWQTITRW